MTRLTMLVGLLSVVASACEPGAPRPGSLAEGCEAGVQELCTPTVCSEFAPGELPAGCVQDAGDATEDVLTDTADVPDISTDADDTVVPDDGGIHDLEDLPDLADEDGSPDTADDGQPDGEETADAEIDTPGDADIGPDLEVDTTPDCSNLDGPCTVGTWNGVECVAEPTPDVACDDGDDCTTGDSCKSDGTCSGDPMDCDDADACTVDTCEAGSCKHSISPGAACDDGSDCTVTDTCDVAGLCSGTPKADGEACPDEGVCLSGICRAAMAWVPGGETYRGCHGVNDEGCNSATGSWATPRTSVTVPAFAIDRFEVTVARYTECVGASSCQPPSVDITAFDSCAYSKAAHENHPMDCVSWFDAQQFCAWDGKRLCSETEWEKAARGGCELYGDCDAEIAPFPWGETTNNLCNYAVLPFIGSSCGVDDTWPVGSKPLGKSAYGVYDMIGNVWELTADCFHFNYVGAPSDGTAWVDEPGCPDGVTVRGCSGDWPDCSTAAYFSAWARFPEPPNDPDVFTGFRCCQSPQ